jgi:dTDP-4-dehydrorhamnose 3,5-epimerase-like enzyme
MYKIDGSLQKPTLVKVQSISDDRGLLKPFTDDIDHELFHRCYVVEDYGKGVIRGLHYHKLEMKIFTIVSGAAKFITMKLPEDLADRNNKNEIKNYVNENPDSIQSWVLSSRHHGVLIIPAYYANGWISLEDHSIMVALSNLRFEKAKDDDIRIDPYIIGHDKWQVIGR